MFEVIYDKERCNVYDVKIEDFDWGYYDGDRIRKPGTTWFLLSIDGRFVWVLKDECTPA